MTSATMRSGRDLQRQNTIRASRAIVLCASPYADVTPPEDRRHAIRALWSAVRFTPGELDADRAGAPCPICSHRLPHRLRPARRDVGTSDWTADLGPARDVLEVAACYAAAPGTRIIRN
jgi:hypothetical protein